MEVTSAGDAIGDLLKFVIEMMARFTPATCWWEPCFSGYGGTPDCELFQLRLLGLHATNFTAHGRELGPAPREQTLRRLLAAHNWTTLFTR